MVHQFQRGRKALLRGCIPGLPRIIQKANNSFARSEPCCCQVGSPKLSCQALSRHSEKGRPSKGFIGGRNPALCPPGSSTVHREPRLSRLLHQDMLCCRSCPLCLPAPPCRGYPSVQPLHDGAERIVLMRVRGDRRHRRLEPSAAPPPLLG